MKTLFCFLWLYWQVSAQIDNRELEFQLLRQDDDVSILDYKEKLTPYENLKLVRLGDKTLLSLGGGYRFQGESFINETFMDVGSQDNLWFLNRVMAYGRLSIKDRFRIFIELNSSNIIGKDAPSPVDKDVLSLNQVFMEYHINERIGVLLGRENLLFGARRLVDIREGPNVRRPFDLIRLNFQDKTGECSIFFATPVQTKPGFFDNGMLQFGETFSGLYTTRFYTTGFNMDTYLFYQKDDTASYGPGTFNERRWSFGTRLFGRIRNLVYNTELVYQMGRFGPMDIRAYTLSFQGECNYDLATSQFVVGLKTEVISGDKDVSDLTLNTFDALYPRGAYFGRVARFGPSNLIDLHPYIKLLRSKYYAELDYDAFWRYSGQDGVYNAALQLEYPSLNTTRFIAHQFGALLGMNVNNHLNLELESNYIIPGNFLHQSNHTASLFHIVLTMEFKI